MFYFSIKQLIGKIGAAEQFLLLLLLVLAKYSLYLFQFIIPIVCDIKVNFPSIKVHSIAMEEQFVDVNGIPIRVRTWGQSLNETFKKKEMILFLCGNPGITGFYITFLTTLFECIKGQTPIWAIGKLIIVFHT